MKKSLLLSVVLMTHFLFVFSQKPNPVLNNLVGPIGVEVDKFGTIVLAESGSGHNDGVVSIVNPKKGSKYAIVDHLPSVQTDEDIVGPWRGINLEYGKLAVIVGANPLEGANLGKILFFDISSFREGDTPLTIADTIFSIDAGAFGITVSDISDSDPFNMAIDEDNNIYVADAGANAITKFSNRGKNKSVFAKFDRIPNPTPIGTPVIDPVPTGIVALPKYGGLLVTTLTGFPFLDGLASIYHISYDGTVTLWKSGMTLLTGIKLDDQGDVYVAQFGTFSLKTFAFDFGSAKVIHLRNGRIIDTIASDYGPGPGLALHNSRTAYMTSLFTGQLLSTSISKQSNSSNLISLENRGREKLEVLVYPNPTSNELRIKSGASLLTGSDLEIIDVNGRVVINQKVLDLRNLSVDVRSLMHGNYVLRYTTTDGVKSQKFNKL